MQIRPILMFFILTLSVYCAGKVMAIDWLGRSGWWSTWLAMIVFIFIAASLRPKAALLAGFFFGLVWMASAFYWCEQMLGYSLNQEGWVPRLVFWALITFEAIPITCFGFLISWSRRAYPNASGLGLPIAFWILAESYWPRVFAWTIGHSQQGWPALVQIADLGGASLISWLVLWGASVPLLVWDKMSQSASNQSRVIACKRVVVLTCTAIFASLAYGYYSIDLWSEKRTHGPSYAIASVQEDPSYVDSVQKMRLATDQLTESYNLICWPESTLGTVSTDLISMADAAAVSAASLPPKVDVTALIGLQKPLILGGRSFDGQSGENVPQHQTAFVVDSDGTILGHYHKRRLMPLGEYVPGEMRWTWLHDWFQLNEFIVPGTSPAPFVMPDGSRIGILVCFEDIIAEVARSTVAAGAEVLVCIINASAFEDPVALEQHMHLARLRCIENRRYLVRVAGTGISCLIAPSGKILKSIEPNATSSFVGHTERLQGQTIYTRFGNWPAWVCLLSIFVFLIRRSDRKCL